MKNHFWVSVFVFLFCGTSLASTECLYQDFASLYRNEFVIYNFMEAFAFQLERVEPSSVDEDAVRKILIQVSQDVFASCGELAHQFSEYDPSSEISVIGSRIFFKFNGRMREVTYQVRDGVFNFSYLAVKRSYKGLGLYRTAIRKGKKVFSHVLGRKKSEEVGVGNFVFDKSGHLIARFRNFQASWEDFKVLSETSGSLEPFGVHVGVIGSGVDYNHPAIAKHLVGRRALQDSVVALDALRSQLTKGFFSSPESFIQAVELFEARSKEVGFPRWMDLAKQSRRPFDEIIFSKSAYDGASSHETMIAGRIISSGKPIGLHSVRVDYSDINPVALDSVIAKFVDRGVSVVNMSFGNPCKNEPGYMEAWAKLFDKYSDLIFVISAGNMDLDLGSNCVAPATFSVDRPHVISVTGLDDDLQLGAPFGIPINYGLPVDFAVRAENLVTYWPAPQKVDLTPDVHVSTSIAASELTRIIAEAILNGVPLGPQNIKTELQKATVTKEHLSKIVGSSGVVDPSLLAGPG